MDDLKPTADKESASYYLPKPLIRAVRVLAAETDRQPAHVVEAALNHYLNEVQTCSEAPNKP